MLCVPAQRRPFITSNEKLVPGSIPEAAEATTVAFILQGLLLVYNLVEDGSVSI